MRGWVASAAEATAASAGVWGPSRSGRSPRRGTPSLPSAATIPRAEELPAAFEGGAVGYQLASVAGYLRSPGVASQRRRRLWLVVEGSVLTALPSPVMGDLTDVAPVVGSFPHPVWRYGLALPVPLEVAHA